MFKENHLSQERVEQHVRVQRMVAGFYLLDALFIGGYAACGVVPAAAPVLYATVGVLTCVCGELAFRSTKSSALSEAALISLQVIAACVVLLAATASLPQIGVLLLMTLLNVVCTGALGLPTLYVIAGVPLISVASIATIATLSTKLSFPMESPALQLITAMWFAVLLLKGATVNLIGSQLRERANKANQELKQVLSKVADLADHDELTGLPNRRMILRLLTAAHQRLKVEHLPYAVALLDIDRFKAVNDRFGHSVGDSVLRVFAGVIANGLRAGDYAARYGGEEFLVLMPGTHSEADAMRTAERLRAAVASYAWDDLSNSLAVTTSIGVSLATLDECAEDIVKRADSGLYRAKSEGRNCVRSG